MKILYYLAPDLELNDPLFRWGTYVALLLREIRALLDACPEFEVGLVLAPAVLDRAVYKDRQDSRIRYFAYENCPSFDDAGLLQGLQRPGEFDDHCVRLKGLTAGFDPDLVLVYEKPSPYVRQCFPDAKVVHVMFGAVSRPPFPMLAAFDAQGIYLQSILGTATDRIREFPLDQTSERALKKIRRRWMRELARYQPFLPEITQLQQQFDRLVLVCCQVDHHYAVTAHAEHDSQADMVRAACEAVDQTTGLIVTQHPYRPALSADDRVALQAEFPNLVIFESEDEVPEVSQFLVPHVDCVVTVSSTLAWQAALWRVPVVVAGHSHVSLVATGGLADIRNILSGELRTDEQANDRVLAFLLFRYNLSYRSDLFNGASYGKFLREFCASLDEDPSGMHWFFDRPVDVGRRYAALVRAVQSHDLDRWFAKRPQLKFGDELGGVLARHRVLSFDLFDTLLDRPFDKPHELFLLLEPSVQRKLGNRYFPFHQLRRDAEADVRQQTGGGYEVTLDQIYARLAERGALDPEQAEMCKQMEIDAEFACCRIKRTMRCYWRTARLLADKLLIVSDFYMEEAQLRPLIEGLGLRPDWFLVSATESLRKHDGQLFGVILRRLETESYCAADMAHIGDNHQADGAMAEKHGIRSHLVTMGNRNLVQSEIGKWLGRTRVLPGINATVLYGLLASKMHSAPRAQITTDDCFRSNPYFLGYAAFGPLIVGFCQWIEWMRRNERLDHLYFLARDGHIVLNVLEALYGKSSENTYLLSSRRASTVSSLRHFDDVIELAYQNFNSQPLADYLFNRFGFELKDRHAEILAANGLKPQSLVSKRADMPRILELLRALETEIMDQARREREAYLQYLDESGFLEKAKSGRIAVVDIGYSGSMQLHIGRMVPEANIGGLYLLTHQTAQSTFEGQLFRGFLADYDDLRIGIRHKLNDHVFVFESGLSSLEPSLSHMRIDDDGRPTAQYIDLESEQSRTRLLAQIHLGTIDFARDCRARLGQMMDDFRISPMLAEHILVQYCELPKPADAAILEGVEVENLFGGGTACLIEPRTRLPRIPGLRTATINGLVERSKWKQGAQSLLRAYRPAEDPLSHKSRAGTQAAKKRKLTRRQRKLAKLANNPRLFFEDSHYKILRPLRHLFGDNRFGRFNKGLFKRLSG